jgi:NADPH2:quinone reductase
MTSTNKQVIFHQYGQPDVLQVMETTMPVAYAGEIVIKVNAIGVNYSDILRRKNRYFMPTPLPFVLGTEAVGVVESMGKGVNMPFEKGTRVLAILPQAGGYAYYVKANAQYCIPLPPSIDDRTATAIFVQGSTAQLMVSQLAGDLKGKTVLINAAAGGVGSILVQLAKMQGATVFGAAGNEEKLIVAGALGADHLINYSNPNWRDQIKNITKGKGVDVIFEMVGGDVYNESIKALVKGGHIIVYGCAGGVQGMIHPEWFVDENITQSGFNLAYFIQHKTPLWQQALGVIIGLFEQGKLRVEQSKIFRLEDAAEAHRQMEARKTTGKVVLQT